jgi:serralysin
MDNKLWAGCVTAALVLSSFAVQVPAVAGTYLCQGQAATIVGTSASETINGTAGADVIVALGGNDTVNGKEGSDIICGSAGRDHLYGMTGFDSLSGGPGNDYIDGGASANFDKVVYLGAPGPVRVNFATGYATGQGTDRLVGVSQVQGSNYADVLVGSGNNELFFGGPGNDTIRAGGSFAPTDWAPEQLYGQRGNDTLYGQSGPDVLSGGPGDDLVNGGGEDSQEFEQTDIALYDDAAGPVNIDLTALTATGWGTDTLADVESARGSTFGDTIIGTDGPNWLDGAGGQDQIHAKGGDDLLQGDGWLFGEGGSDRLMAVATGGSMDGGDGSDTADFRNAAGVTANLRSGSAYGRIDRTNTTFSETLVAIENLIGSANGVTGDTLIGDAADNRILGGVGINTIYGGDGNDTLIGHGELYGEAGDDTIDVSNSLSGDIADGGPGTDTCRADPGDTVVNCP